MQLELCGLDEDAVAAVLARHEATGDAAAYRERTGGNPFFLDELLRDEAEDGRAQRPAAGRARGDRPRASPASRRRPRAACCRRAPRSGLEFEPLVLDARPSASWTASHAAVAAGLLDRRSASAATRSRTR